MGEDCRELRDLLVAHSMPELQDVSAADRATLDGHLRDCPDCRNLRAALREDEARLTGFVAAREESLARIAAAIDEGISATVPQSPPAAPPRGLRHPGWRLALAACLVIVVFLGIDLFTREGGPGVVWADVISQVESANAYICRRVEKRSGEPALEMVEYRSAAFGLRQDIFRKGRLQASQYIDPGAGVLYALVHRDHTWLRQRLDPETVDELKRLSDAKEIVRSFRDQEHRSLGRRRIDGRTAEGIEIADPAGWSAIYSEGSWRLWVDLETQWPVRIELTGVARGGKVHKTYTLTEFQWNPPLSAEDFRVDIPPDYKLIADLAPVTITEDGALTGLRDYARLTGKYPGALDLATAISEAEKILDSRHNGYTRAAGRDLEALFTIRNACEFHQVLQDSGASPEYHGATVGPEDFDRVLLRWRLEDGSCRTVFGDLRAITEAAPQEESERR